MKLKLFLSSRNNDVLHIDGKDYENMTQTRLFLKEELEKEMLLGEALIDVRINEEFASDGSMDSYEKCLQEVSDADFTISIYNGAAGWAPPGIDMGICHAELDRALNISEKKTAIIDVSAFYNIKEKDKGEKARNENFKQYLNVINRFTNPLKLDEDKKTEEGYREQLLKSIKSILYSHILDRIKMANLYYDITSNNRISLDWKKMKYSERDQRICKILKDLTDKDVDFNGYCVSVSSIPDNMSVSDAKAYTGRPFLKDHSLISVPKKGKAEYGPIHFIGVYGNATEIQTKNLIGYPDLSVITGEFGLYVWEQNTHIQLIFLTGCKTPSALKSNYLLFQNWSKTTRELKKISKRAEARYHILKSINEAQEIAKG